MARDTKLSLLLVTEKKSLSKVLRQGTFPRRGALRPKGAVKPGRLSWLRLSA
jgi:hypothetical protein